jgi:hypothetical protein
MRIAQGGRRLTRMTLIEKKKSASICVNPRPKKGNDLD